MGIYLKSVVEDWPVLADSSRRETLAPRSAIEKADARRWPAGGPLPTHL